MTIEDLRQQKLILFEGISGSRAYGLDLPGSDIDIRGVFVLPESRFYGLGYLPQVNDESNDVTFYELTRFMELLAKNNPNILELLHLPPDCVVYKHRLFDRISSDLFLSRQCRNTFTGFAMAQLKKAGGLNKKILNPMKRKRKSVLDFCTVIEDQYTYPLVSWLEERHWQQEDCGLLPMERVKDMYALYYDPSELFDYRGIITHPTANDVALSNITQSEAEAFYVYVYFNRDGYSAYCKQYQQYWNWVNERNEDRFQATMSHGKGYDAKNMMHTFRLLDMAAEILEQGKVIVRRPNRGELLRIRAGGYEYGDLIRRAELKVETINKLYKKSPLPEKADHLAIEKLLLEIRKTWYKRVGA